MRVDVVSIVVVISAPPSFLTLLVTFLTFLVVAADIVRLYQRQGCIEYLDEVTEDDFRARAEVAAKTAGRLKLKQALKGFIIRLTSLSSQYSHCTPQQNINFRLFPPFLRLSCP